MAGWLAGCTAVPPAEELRASSAFLPAESCDGRAQFRQVFCTLAGQKQTQAENAEEQCADTLWRLDDEPPALPAPGPRSLPPDLRVFIVGGAFSDCFGEASLAFRTGIEHLRAQGVDIEPLPISGRSSAAANAAMLADALAARALSAPETVILIGYSKGTVDILQYFADYPGAVALVDAVISVAGPVSGSAVADAGAWAYDTLLAHAFSGRCDPGDGGVIDSLLTETRQNFLRDHPPPDSVRYYSMLAFTTGEHLSRGLRPSWRILARTDRRNDGQVTPEEGMLPHSTLLGYANADHWEIAIDIEQELPFVAGRQDKRNYPRDALLEAMVRYVAADLNGSDAACVTGTAP